MPTISIIGAQGKFGTKLASHVEQLCFSDLTLFKTCDEYNNEKIAKKSDLIMIAVQPDHVIQILREIRDVLKKDIEIVSFAAAVSIDKMSSTARRSVSRAMMNTEATWGMVAYANSRPDIFMQVFNRTLKYKPRITNNDDDINEFTIAQAYAFAVTLWAFSEHKSQNWLNPYLRFIAPKYGLAIEDTNEIISMVRKHGNFKKMISIKGTAGGVSAKIIEVLQNRGETSPEELYQITVKQMAKMIAKTSGNLGADQVFMR